MHCVIYLSVIASDTSASEASDSDSDRDRDRDSDPEFHIAIVEIYLCKTHGQCAN